MSRHCDWCSGKAKCTHWVADYLKGREAAVELLTSLANDGLAISLVTYGEIYEGIYYSGNPEKAEQGFRQFLRWVDVLPLNRDSMQRFARIRGELRSQGMLIGDPDTLIAATAIHHNLLAGHSACEIGPKTHPE